MKRENPFDHKSMEKVLFAAFKHQLPPGRQTRKYLRKMARHLEHSWEIGHRDGLAKKALIPLEKLQGDTDSPLVTDMKNLAYVAYCAGHRCGALERKGG